MDFALSSNWHGARHTVGEALVDEALALGFAALELGYNFQPELREGVLRRLAAGAVRIVSLHAYCPVPLGAPAGHPELYLLADTEEDMRRMAVLGMGHTLSFAAEVGARAIVAHAGRVPVGGLSRWLVERQRAGATGDRLYRWRRGRLLRARARRAGRNLTALRRSLDELLPACERAGVALCLENLPSWDGLPNEDETEALIASYATPWLRYWHDMGHGEIRQQLGFGDHARTARRLLPCMRGVHIHDVGAALRDHLAPGAGTIDFSEFAFLARPDMLSVFEPAADVAAADLAQGLAHVRQAWSVAERQSG